MHRRTGWQLPGDLGVPGLLSGWRDEHPAHQLQRYRLLGPDEGPRRRACRTSGPANQKDHMFGTWATLDCDVPYVKVPRISVIFTYPVSAAGGHFASDDKNGDGEPDGEPGASFHLDFVYVVGQQQGRRRAGLLPTPEGSMLGSAAGQHARLPVRCLPRQPAGHRDAAQGRRDREPGDRA